MDRTHTPHDLNTPPPTAPGGFLVSLDGPSGVGKTTTTQQLHDLLAAAGHRTVLETQPSSSPIGALARHSTHTIHGLALTCLMAADRYHHLTTTLLPHLAAGRVVVCDRYTPTAFVLDQLDGAETEFIASLYRYARPADLFVFLTASPRVCVDRARSRGSNYSRFHHTDTRSAEREQALFAETAQRYQRAGLPVLELSTQALATQEVAAHIAERVRAELVARHAGRGRVA
ncbi:dTMP kinase [Nocardiopsis metallicus]|uniref:Thymidylate kinase n=1 Tax=Nocardiopsis metallicus TaxID=179819 RepID=A0A840WFE6_9ACTN|nr:AAA family ATPase [Nocardiopsis metallicus]MBB5495689.1 dTMP kinase [Nocardiopsis metallicus]